MVYIHNECYSAIKKNEMGGTRDQHVKQSKPGSERQRSHAFSQMWKLDLKNKCINK
jgi:hypothetical protein